MNDVQDPRSGSGPVADAYDSEADAYGTFYTSRRCKAEDARLARLLHAFLDPADYNVLDIGCGPGTLLKLVNLVPPRYTGIDISPRMIGKARDAFPQHRFHLGDVTAMPFSDRMFDVAISLFCLSDTKAPLTALREIRRVLTYGGNCFLVVYAPRWYRHNPQRAGTLYLKTNPAAWSRWQAKERMYQAGFRAVSLSAFSLLPPPFLAVEGLLSRTWPMAGRYLIIEAIRV